MNHKFLMTAALCLTLTAGLAMTGCSSSKTGATETTNKATTEAASETDAAKSTTFAAETSVTADDAEGTAALDTMIGTVQSTDPDRNYITITVMASYAAGEVPDFDTSNMPGGFQNGQMPGNFPGSGNSGSSGTTLTYMISDSSVLKDADGNTITLSDITENMFVQFSAENGIVAEMVVTVMTVPETPSGN